MTMKSMHLSAVFSNIFYKTTLQYFLLPQSRTEAKAEDTINTRIYVTGNRARENKILLTQIQANRRPEVPLQQRAADTRPHNL